MITKVLVAEDHELANVSVQHTLAELGINDIDYVHYCDDALLKIQTCTLSGNPYDLLITDLSFDPDGSRQQITDGITLIEKSRGHLPALKVLVLTAESRPAVIESLFRVNDIDGYVRKSRNDGKELKLAIETLAQNQRYLPRHISQLINKQHAYEFTGFDIEILTLLAGGVSQKNIPEYLLKKDIYPSSLSSVEKRLNHMKTELGCTKNEQLVAFCKDMGVI